MSQLAIEAAEKRKLNLEELYRLLKTLMKNNRFRKNGLQNDGLG
jgi:hypothetical protein